MRRPFLLAGAAIATTLGTGFCPFAPGTVGSLAALAAYLAWGMEHPGLAAVAAVALVPVSLAGARAGTALWGRDPARVNIDEFLGTWVACLPAGRDVILAVGAFALFRLLDILKPWPVCVFDRMEGAPAVVLDDLAAGLMAAAAVWAVVFSGVR